MIWNDPKKRLPEIGDDGYSRWVLIRVAEPKYPDSVLAGHNIEYYIAQLYLVKDGTLVFQIVVNYGWIDLPDVTHWTDIVDPITGATVI